MADATGRRRYAGFSLVELLVALVFTMLLMAGMAAVFKASLTTFYTSGEKLSSFRRNRLSIELLVDDLNNAGMYLTNLTALPSVSSTNPPFQVVPSSSDTNGIVGVTRGADGLFFYFDQPLPFEGLLIRSDSSQVSKSQLVATGATLNASTDSSYAVDCLQDAYAGLVEVGDYFILKDSWEALQIAAKTTGSTSHELKLTAGASALAGVTGTGATGLPSNASHLDHSGVVFVRPAQMVRYQIQLLNLDPASSSPATPCLVRDQGVYNPSQNASVSFTTTEAQQIVAENVTGFRVSLSTDSGITWVRSTDYTGKTWDDMRTGLDTQLATSGRAGYTTTRNSEHWFRSIPVLVQVEVTTRTAQQRTEYSNSQTPTLAYKEQTQTFVIVPRHFGLPLATQ